MKKYVLVLTSTDSVEEARKIAEVWLVIAWRLQRRSPGP
jgi:hypothetical protein